MNRVIYSNDDHNSCGTFPWCWILRPALLNTGLFLHFFFTFRVRDWNHVTLKSSRFGDPIKSLDHEQHPLWSGISIAMMTITINALSYTLIVGNIKASTFLNTLQHCKILYDSCCYAHYKYRFGYHIKILKSQWAFQKVEKYLVVMFIETCHQFSSFSDANFKDALLLHGLRCSSS